jgi:hypothetical protein
MTKTTWVKVCADDVMNPNGDLIHDGVVLDQADALDELRKALEHVLNNLSMVQETSMDPVVGPTYYCYGIHLNKARDTLKKFKAP